ncbi:Ldh family oxidoreductase [Paenisporosarcina antarctica]|uniref:Ldh family oxidoreductase n=1 Tax=Paenisporosarcina antarctica TaxID=417367 RepID=A0A4P7A1I5_9BACL|nr:Ldh family oxidoreductase [Paenisporosarcina antarctica]QBP42712.1 Ldh family oxidoreductase [Paenisporosarcina antarctica]
MNKKISEIFELTQKILEASGVNPKSAREVTESIVDAEKRGIESHGLIRLKPYVDRIQGNLINAEPNIKIVKDNSSIMVIDGDNGLGQVVAIQTLEYCFEKLQTNSTVMATVRNSNHFGTAGYFSRIAAENGFLAIVASNASPTMAPWGGVNPLLGTNPIAMSFPANNFGDFTLDMATSGTAKGKIRTYERNGTDMPPGLAIDKDGYETQDPKTALNGSLLPIGQHKGYGLSMFIDVLCAGLSGASLSSETESMFKSGNVANTGQFFLLIKIEDVVDSESFKDRMESWFQLLKNSEERPGFEEILIPGELENRKKKENSQMVNVSETTYGELQEMAMKLNIQTD